MCRRGVQRLPEEEVLDLLDRFRAEYPNVCAVRRRDSQSFLALLEARSSILIKAGGLWLQNKNRETPVWEFRHLTFQEYLAARALLDGRYPGRDKTRTLAEQVAPLAGAMERVERKGPMPGIEHEVPESWREALRLLVADCKDDDVCRAAIHALGRLGDKRAIEPLASLLSEKSPKMIIAVASALVNLCDERGRNTFFNLLDNDEPRMRSVAVSALATKNNYPQDAWLLSEDFDGTYPWLDPRTPITEQRIEEAAEKLGISPKEARACYEALAVDFRLRFA